MVHVQVCIKLYYGGGRGGERGNNCTFLRFGKDLPNDLSKSL